jgi:hypothetical protein
MKILFTREGRQRHCQALRRNNGATVGRMNNDDAPSQNFTPAWRLLHQSKSCAFYHANLLVPFGYAISGLHEKTNFEFYHTQ